MKKRILAILGPTASGKTRLSVEIAKKFQAEIISADSRQFYRELNVGVAKPNSSELAEVKHHFINSHSILKPLTAGQYAKEALSCCKSYFKIKDVLVLVGGSGLYVDALLEGLDDLPTNQELQKQINQWYLAEGIEGLILRIEAINASALTTIDIQNPRRLIRLLEVLILLNGDVNSVESKQNTQRDFEVIRFYIQWKREELYERINERVEDMIRDGLENEVKELLPFKNLKPLQTVGYREFFDYFNGEYTRETAVSKIQQHTRNYAKRQLT